MKKRQIPKLICDWEQTQEDQLARQRIGELITEANEIVCNAARRGAADFIIANVQIGQILIDLYEKGR
jgi:hypothetical protein